ncbi:hypothetical protein [Castellaniella sp.]|uniref:hypothetical protein n=1 Tax=Castellaniella sp. TaxID=1955812 RepID=UPI002AFE5C58|nr:hypothetical protein [Castellaniella sp.]
MKKDATAPPATTVQLKQALAAARLNISLEDALRSPALTRCLEITAEVMVSDPDLCGARTDHRASREPLPVLAHEVAAPRMDVKRAAAGDTDD